MRTKPWAKGHNPSVRPLGCNGKPGYSGRNLHIRRGEPVCGKCKAAVNHADRERRRGQTYGRPPEPCGTRPAAERHRVRGEPLDFACKLAEAKYHADLRAKTIEAVPTGAASSIPTDKDQAA